jgi:hypothetical protein
LLLEVGVLGADLVHLLAQALLEAFGGARHHVASERGADQDPDRQCDEDGRERRDVVARRVAHLET